MGRMFVLVYFDDSKLMCNLLTSTVITEEEAHILEDELTNILNNDPKNIIALEIDHDDNALAYGVIQLNVFSGNADSISEILESIEDDKNQISLLYATCCEFLKEPTTH